MSYFTYAGNNITDNFDSTYPGSQSTGYLINGIDIGTSYTPAYSGFTSSSTTNFQKAGTDIKSLFSSSKPKPTITFSSNSNTNGDSFCVHDQYDGKERFIFYQDAVSNQSSCNTKYNMVVSNVTDANVTIVLCGGGGGGGIRGNMYAGSGGGGGGAVITGGITLNNNNTYTIEVGGGGAGDVNGFDAILTGSGITTGIIAKGGGRGGSDGPHEGQLGGCGGGGANGYGGGSTDDGNFGGKTGLTVYNNIGGTSWGNRGGAGGGGAGAAGDNVSNDNGYGSNGGAGIELYGLYMSGGGPGRGDGGRNNHATGYEEKYGGGGRGDEDSKQGGIVMILFDTDEAISNQSNGTIITT